MVENTRPIDPTLFEKVSSEVAPEVSPLMRLLLNNATRIAVVLAVCVLGASGYGVYNWHSSKQLAETQVALARILVLADDADKIAKLKRFQSTATEGAKPAVALALARTAMQQKDYETANLAWTELAKNSKDSFYSIAMIGRAETLAAQGKHAEGLALLEGMALAANSVSGLLVNSMIVDMAEKTDNFEKAIAACDKIIAATMINPEEADFWRQKAAALRNKVKATNS